MQTIKWLTLTSLCLAALCFSIAAQDTGVPGGAPGAPGPRHHGFSAAAKGQQSDRPFPPDPNFRFVGSEMHFGGAPIKGAPYSATAVTENVQTLKDGTSISRKDSASVYRDSDGRTRVEQTISKIGPFAASGEARQMTSIQDPVAGVHYVLDAQNKTAQKMTSQGGTRPPSTQNHQFSASSAKKESLGTQVIEGVQAEGTRTTFTIPAGQIGNDRAIDIVDERWYSPDLQVVVLSKHSDPRMGEHVYRLTNINRSEPARSLFDVPSDYTVTERTFNRVPSAPRAPRPQTNN